MKILIITPNFPPQGAGMSERAYSLVKQWAPYTGKILVITPIEGPSTDSYQRMIVSLKGHYLWQAYKLSWVIRNVVRKNNIDKIFCMSWSPAGIAVLLSGAYRKRCWAVAVNGFDVIDGTKAARNRFILRNIFKRVNKIYSPSEFLKKKVLSLGDFAEKTKVISNGVDIDKFSHGFPAIPVRERYNLGDNIVIMVACRLRPIKGVDVLIDSFNKLTKKFSNLRLLIVGDGEDEDKLKNKVLSLDLKEKVVFTGWVPYGQVPSYYAACDIFVQSNRVYQGFAEGQGISLMEAALAAKPAVSTLTGGIPEVVANNETGFLVAPESVDELAEKIEYLIANPEIAKKMGEKARQIAKEKFDIRKNAKDILEDLNG